MNPFDRDGWVFHRVVAIWQNGTDWKNGKYFDKHGIGQFHWTTPKWRRHWDKTKEPPL